MVGLCLESTDLVASVGDFGSEVLDLGQETDDLCRPGLGELGRSLCTSLCPSKVDVRPRLNALEICCVRDGEAFGGLPTGSLQVRDVLAAEALEDLGMSGEGGVELGA